MNRKKLWGIIFLYTGVIYLTVPFAPYFVDLLRSIAGKNYNYFMTILIILGLVIITKGTLKFITNPRGYFWLFYLLLSGIIITFSIDIPAERIHFLEYGLLGFLLTEAVELPSPYKYIIAFIIGGIIGFTDELIQGVLQIQNILPLPRRYFEWKDIFMNSFGVFLGIVFSKYAIGKDEGILVKKS